ncbi:hypothetical protein KSP40_PGU021609 [Platanthera guangdongensis]|uniref:Uncharacterized protein n=1 Tax=Platanthera guangdongensis TaxID=2320717 RepID=A0ABR2M564_9ASPA
MYPANVGMAAFNLNQVGVHRTDNVLKSSVLIFFLIHSSRGWATVYWGRTVERGSFPILHLIGWMCPEHGTNLFNLASHSLLQAPKHLFNLLVNSSQIGARRGFPALVVANGLVTQPSAVSHCRASPLVPLDADGTHTHRTHQAGRDSEAWNPPGERKL